MHVHRHKPAAIRTPEDTIVGTPGNDTLTGTAGNDDIDGGAGADAMSGGAGSDRYRVDNAGDTVIESASQGNDSVYASVSYTLGDYVENLTLLTAAALSGTGNALANRLTGNSGKNALSGELGNDTLLGNAGNDTLHGGDGNDLLSGGLAADAMYGDAGIDAFVDARGDGVDTIDGGAGNDSLTADWGDVLTDIVWINDGTAQRVNGQLLASIESIDVTFGAGNDVYEHVIGYDGAVDATYDATIHAGDGNDSLTGGAFRDHFYGGAGDDTLYAALAGSSWTSTAHGDAGNDLITGGSGICDMYGDDGNDTLVAGNGHDALDGGAGDDVLTGAHSDIYGAHLEGGAGNDTLTGSARLDGLYGDDGDDHVYGGSGGGFVDGGTGNDLLDAGAGNDTITAGNGNDTVYAGDGDDEVRLEYAGIWNEADTFDGGAGHDRFGANWSGATESINLTFDATTQSLYGDTFTNFETFDLMFGAGDDTITAAVSGRFVGGYGDDLLTSTYKGSVSLTGSSGNDTLIGSTGNDNFDGGYDDDSVVGGDGNDYMYNSSGNDTFDGGLGKDRLIAEGSATTTMTGGGGADSFEIESRFGMTTVLDFKSGADKMYFDWHMVGDDRVLDMPTTVQGPGGFAAEAELVIVTGSIAGAITAASAAAAIGSASNAYRVYQAVLFIVDNGSDSAAFRFESSAKDAVVSADELTLLVSLAGTGATTVSDYGLS